jgi:hypothetical protein
MAQLMTTCLESMMQQSVASNVQRQPKVINRRIRKVVKRKRINPNPIPNPIPNVNLNPQSHIPFINVNPLVNPNNLDNPLVNSNPFGVINPVNNTVNPNLTFNTFNNTAL